MIYRITSILTVSQEIDTDGLSSFADIEPKIWSESFTVGTLDLFLYQYIDVMELTVCYVGLHLYDDKSYIKITALMPNLKDQNAIYEFEIQAVEPHFLSRNIEYRNVFTAKGADDVCELLKSSVQLKEFSARKEAINSKPMCIIDCRNTHKHQ